MSALAKVLVEIAKVALPWVLERLAPKYPRAPGKVLGGHFDTGTGVCFYCSKQLPTGLPCDGPS